MIDRIRRAIIALVVAMLAVGGFIASAPAANAYVLHDDVDTTVCHNTGAGNVQLTIYYWSWTDSAGVKWVAMKTGKHIRVDITGSGFTVQDPEGVSLIRSGILYAYAEDSAGGDASSTYIYGIAGLAPPQNNALDFTISSTDGKVHTSVANNGISQPWTTGTGNPGEGSYFIHQFHNSDRPFIHFDYEAWTPGDDAIISNGCSIVLINHF